MKNIWLRSLFLNAVFCMSLSAASWKVFLYMDASDGLCDMAIKTITDLIRTKVGNSVDFSIQLHAYRTTGLRYRITSRGLSFVSDLALTGNSKQDFINAAQWAFARENNDNNVNHTMLIFWNHGWGILDPQWHDNEHEWRAGIEALNNSCSIKKTHSLEYKFHKKYHRGYLFSVVPRAYLNNQDMVEGLSFIKDKVLGKKLDVIAFDTCMGGMLETAYQIAAYTNYLVGNQVCSLIDGFDYHAIVHVLNRGPEPRDMAAEMVRVFDQYYREHDNTGIYAHTALDSTCVEHVTRALDDVVTLLLARPDGATIAYKAHGESPRFCLFPMYTDPVSYVKQVEKLIPGDESTVQLKQAMSTFYKVVETFVVARCAGYENVDRVHGCAIYLPSYSIDTSYRKTLFGQQAQWIKLLEAIEKQEQPKVEIN